jgi:hypothetical protein
MRGIDWKLATVVRDHWLGISAHGFPLCPLLANLDRLLAYLDEAGIKPGHAVACCPECGDEHRWALLHELMRSVLEIYPDRKSALLKAVDRNLEPVRALYGGKEKYEEMRRAAEAYFASVDASASKYSS